MPADQTSDCLFVVSKHGIYPKGRFQLIVFFRKWKYLVPSPPQNNENASVTLLRLRSEPALPLLCLVSLRLRLEPPAVCCHIPSLPGTMINTQEKPTEAFREK